MTEPTTPEEAIQRFIDGDDVVTQIGVGAFETPHGKLPYATAIVLYSKLKDLAEREAYTRLFEEAWDRDEFIDGFGVVQTAPGKMTVSSKKRSSMTSVGAEVRFVEAPIFYTDFENSPEFVTLFFETAEKTSYWILHLETTLASYIFIVDYPSGRIISKIRRSPPVKIVNINEGDEA